MCQMHWDRVVVIGHRRARVRWLLLLLLRRRLLLLRQLWLLLLLQWHLLRALGRRGCLPLHWLLLQLWLWLLLRWHPLRALGQCRCLPLIWMLLWLWLPLLLSVLAAVVQHDDDNALGGRHARPR